MSMATKRSIGIWIFFGTLIIIAWFLGFAPVTRLSTATAQQAAPTEDKGVTRTPLTALDLGTQIPGMQGRQLRLRMVTIEPGGVIGMHSHKDRPVVLYMLKGTYTDHRGDVVREHRAGGSWNEDVSVTHWVENKGKSPAAYIVGEIFKQP